MARKRINKRIARQLPRLERPKSLTAQVEQILRQAIIENYFPSGKLPTEIELAEQLGVSRETVRLACEALEHEGLLHKVRRRGTFLQPAATLSPLRPNRARVIVYLQADYAHSPVGEEAVVQTISGLMLQGALCAAAQADCSLLVRQVPLSAMRRILEDLPRYVAPVGIIFASYGEEKVVKAALGLGVPVLLLDHDLPTVHAHSVRDDSYQAAIDVVQSLARRGHRYIAFVNWQREELNPWRLQGYRDGLRQAGLPRRRAWEIAVPLNRHGAQQAVRYLLELRPRPTAIYCFNNTLARYVWDELRQHQIAVPQEISLVGGGGENVPDLSCHQADWEGMGQLAVEVILRHGSQLSAHAMTRSIFTPPQTKSLPAPALTTTRPPSHATSSPSTTTQSPPLLEHHVCPHRFLEGRTVASRAC
uniref:Hypothetical conserved protein n=1 Tax=uncultured Planctomycetota bacterium TaxID=120965 RepID=H5SCS6_9BACT|nr:hypothetical conserved protein [uncultured Planctomycetota bacterium]